MRFMVMVKATPSSEAGVMPSAEMLARMGDYNNALVAAGVMLDGGGLKASAKGVRILFDGDEPVVVDGPFTETKELIAGYWIWECQDMADAIGWLRKAPFIEGALEIRPFLAPEDFAGGASDEAIAQEAARRERQATTR